jgi:extracellular factor (EF) 3-hydroxypalmitic acid methyl ester biosynthesis protein
MNPVVSVTSEVDFALQDFAQFLPCIAQLPPEIFCSDFHRRLNYLERLSQEMPHHRAQLMSRCFAACTELDQSVINHRMRHKPLGYAGDYLTIDIIYESASKKHTLPWDAFAFAAPAALGVIDRKRFFIDTFRHHLQKHGRPINVLNLASGPCRDVLEAIRSNADAASDSFFYCVDTEPRAIRHAQNLLKDINQVSFHWENKNALRIRPAKEFDLVWSAGLFDYLSDSVAVAFIKRMVAFAHSGGTIIFGNAHPKNPTRNFIEWCTAWFLIHRTEEDLLRLCVQAGVDERHVRFDKEENGVFIFCIIEKP